MRHHITVSESDNLSVIARTICQFHTLHMKWSLSSDPACLSTFQELYLDRQEDVLLYFIDCIEEIQCRCRQILTVQLQQTVQDFIYTVKSEHNVHKNEHLLNVKKNWVKTYWLNFFRTWRVTWFNVIRRRWFDLHRGEYWHIALNFG